MIQRITFVTNPSECNLRCPMCKDFGTGILSGSTPQMPFSWIENTITHLVSQGLREVIPSTIGEPLLYAHFERLLDLLGERHIALNLTTNGTFPRGGVTRWAPKIAGVASDVKFSIQAVRPALNELLMRGINAKEQQANILAYHRIARQNGPGRVSIQVTAQRMNAEDLPQLLHWAIEHDLDRVKVNRIWVHQKELEPAFQLSEAQWQELVQELHGIAGATPRPNGSFIRLECRGVTGVEPGPCPFLGREAWVMADGSFRVCCHPAYERGQFPDLGRVPQKELSTVWNSVAYQELCGNYQELPLCGTCRFRMPQNL